VRAFLGQRLGVSLRDPDEKVEDALPVELDGLARWSVGQRLLEARLAGTEWDACAAAERARGTLPPGALAESALQSAELDVEALVAAALESGDGGGEPASVEVNLRLPDGRALVGTVSGVKGTRLRTATFSRVAEKHRLAAWVRLLAVTAAHPESPVEAVIVGRCRDGGPKNKRVTVVRIALAADDPAQRRELALRQIAVLVDLHHRGLCEPLPLYCATSAAYAAAAEAGDDARAAAKKTWTTEWRPDREDRDPEHVLVLGGEVEFEELLIAPPRDDECGEGWVEEETSRLGRYARRLWRGLLGCEEIIDL
jgi:exodeoxyribonuclease V gamma subunit